MVIVLGLIVGGITLWRVEGLLVTVVLKIPPLSVLLLRVDSMVFIPLSLRLVVVGLMDTVLLVMFEMLIVTIPVLEIALVMDGMITVLNVVSLMLVRVFLVIIIVLRPLLFEVELVLIINLDKSVVFEEFIVLGIIFVVEGVITVVGSSLVFMIVMFEELLVYSNIKNHSSAVYDHCAGKSLISHGICESSDHNTRRALVENATSSSGRNFDFIFA